MNKNALKSVMSLKGETNRDLANLLGISEQSVSAKMNGNKSEFKQGEIAKICRHYNLTKEQLVNIFFN